MAMETLHIHRPMRIKELGTNRSTPAKEVPPYGELYKRGPYLAPITKPTGAKAK